MRSLILVYISGSELLVIECSIWKAFLEYVMGASHKTDDQYKYQFLALASMQDYSFDLSIL
jgi:hypothetical protein